MRLELEASGLRLELGGRTELGAQAAHRVVDVEPERPLLARELGGRRDAAEHPLALAGEEEAVRVEGEAERQRPFQAQRPGQPGTRPRQTLLRPFDPSSRHRPASLAQERPFVNENPAARVVYALKRRE